MSAQHKIPIIFYFNGVHPGAITVKATSRIKISYGLLAKRAQLVFYTAWDTPTGTNARRWTGMEK